MSMCNFWHFLSHGVCRTASVIGGRHPRTDGTMVARWMKAMKDPVIWDPVIWSAALLGLGWCAGSKLHCHPLASTPNLPYYWFSLSGLLYYSSFYGDDSCLPVNKSVSVGHHCHADILIAIVCHSFQTITHFLSHRGWLTRRPSSVSRCRAWYLHCRTPPQREKRSGTKYSSGIVLCASSSLRNRTTAGPGAGDCNGIKY